MNSHSKFLKESLHIHKIYEDWTFSHHFARTSEIISVNSLNFHFLHFSTIPRSLSIEILLREEHFCTFFNKMIPLFLSLELDIFFLLCTNFCFTSHDSWLSELVCKEDLQKLRHPLLCNISNCYLHCPSILWNWFLLLIGIFLLDETTFHYSKQPNLVSPPLFLPN